mgnify:CR=1 FL=1
MLLVRRGRQPLVAAWPWRLQRWRVRLLSVWLAPLLLWRLLPLLLLPLKMGAEWPSAGPGRPAGILGLLLWLLLERRWKCLGPRSRRARGPQLRLRRCDTSGSGLLGLCCTLRLLLLCPSLLGQA